MTLEMRERTVQLRRRWKTAKRELRAWLFARKLDYLVGMRKQTPVLIYQMGKVGSSSVYSSFPTRKHPLAVHLHRLHDGLIQEKIDSLRAAGLPVAAHYDHGKAVFRRVIQRNRRCKVITLVREPIGRNMSFFFERFAELVGVRFADSTHSVDQLIDIFLQHEGVLDRSAWFDTEFLPSLGIDVYLHPFPQDSGHTRITSGNCEILLLQVELDDRLKEQCIAEFLDDPDFRLGSANIGANKEYALAYQEFKSTIVLPESYIHRMLDSRYTRHFYSDAQIEVIRHRWLSRRTERLEPCRAGRPRNRAA